MTVRTRLDSRREQEHSTAFVLREVARRSGELLVQARRKIHEIVERSGARGHGRWAQTFQAQLVECGLWPYACGEVDGTLGPDSVELFWTSVATAIAEEFTPFAWRDREQAGALRRRVLPANKGALPAFWQVDQSAGPARLWLLVALYIALGKPASLRETAAEWEALLRTQKRDWGDPSSGPGKDPGVDRARRYAADQLRRSKFGAVRRGSAPRPPDVARAKARLCMCVVPGQERAPALEVSLILRALAGRYLHGCPACPHEWFREIAAGIGYVLRRQEASSGRWDVSGLALQRYCLGQ